MSRTVIGTSGAGTTFESRAVACLLSALLGEPPYRDVVHFTHDIYEDWAIARALDAQRSTLPSLLKSARQPLAWLRAVRLVAEITVDAEGAEAWRALHAQLRNDPDLDPVWARQVLVAPLASPRAHTLLDRIEPELLIDNAALMRELARAGRRSDCRVAARRRR